MPACFKDVVEPDDIALDIDIRILDAVAHTCLGGQVDNDIELVLLEEAVNQFTVSNTALYGDVVEARRLRLLQMLEPVLFEAGVIVIVEVVNTYDGALFQFLEEALHQVASYEPGMAGN